MERLYSNKSQRLPSIMCSKSGNAVCLPVLLFYLVYSIFVPHSACRNTPYGTISACGSVSALYAFVVGPVRGKRQHHRNFPAKKGVVNSRIFAVKSPFFTGLRDNDELQLL